MNEGRLLYRPAEAAELLSLSRVKLYQLLTRGEIWSVKIAASRRIPASELHAYVERLRAGGNTDERAEPMPLSRSSK